MSKKVVIDPKPSKNIEGDNWVKNRNASENMKRLTIDVSESLHRKIKMQCAERGTKIADEVRELLQQKYGS